MKICPGIHSGSANVFLGLAVGGQSLYNWDNPYACGKLNKWVLVFKHTFHYFFSNSKEFPWALKVYHHLILINI